MEGFTEMENEDSKKTELDIYIDRVPNVLV